MDTQGQNERRQMSPESESERSSESGSTEQPTTTEARELVPATRDAGGTVQEVVQAGISAVADQSVNTINALGEIAEKGSSYVMLTLGSFLIVMSFVWKTQLGGVGVSELAPAEFIAAVLTGALLIVLGAGLRTYNNNMKRSMFMSSLQTSEEVSDKAVQAMKELQHVQEEGYQRQSDWREEEVRAQRDDARQRADALEVERRRLHEVIEQQTD
jgi:ABC-type multidrug transport system fused ATPase/permease subunit